MENIDKSPLALGAAAPLMSVMRNKSLPKMRSNSSTRRASAQLSPEERRLHLASVLESALRIMDNTDTDTSHFHQPLSFNRRSSHTRMHGASRQ
mmetsp:Transcript_10355/g.14612  ORF Transcript_10355/g.14612 Transcript_10355/m.14612 type:complete len:94 (+) Transcript_10355:75-356(+)